MHMCLLRPSNKEEMPEVSGVGEMKYGRYGERFLEVIRESGENDKDYQKNGLYH